MKYQRPAAQAGAAAKSELATIKLRFKRPRSESSELTSIVIENRANPIAQASKDFRFASAVAGFGMLLLGSEHRGTASYPMLRSPLGTTGASAAGGTRREFVGLVARGTARQEQRTSAKSLADYGVHAHGFRSQFSSE